MALCGKKVIHAKTNPYSLKQKNLPRNTGWKFLDSEAIAFKDNENIPIREHDSSQMTGYDRPLATGQNPDLQSKWTEFWFKNLNGYYHTQK